MKHERIINYVLSRPWAIQADALENLIGIIQGYGESINALETRLGRPLEKTQNVVHRGDTAVLSINGPIFRYANVLTNISGATSLEILATDFQSADDNPKIKNIVLDIDSPGGDATSIAEFAALVRNAKTPVTSYVGGSGNSAAYWIGAAANKVYLGKTAMVGSIGAVFTAELNGEGERIKIISSQSPKKQLSPATKEGRAEMQALIDSMAQVFIDDVAAFRGVSVEKVLSDFGQGGVKMGLEAVAAGMADGVSSLEAIIAGLSGDNQSTHEVFMSGENNKPVLTLEQLKAQHPDLAKQLQAEGENQALAKLTDEQSEIETKAKADESKRIGEVLALNSFGFDAELKQMALDGKTAAEAALELNKLQAEAGDKELKALKAGSNQPVNSLSEETKPETRKGAFDDLEGEEKYQAEWGCMEKNAKAHYMGDFATYAAYRRAEDDDLIRFHNSGSK